ncbi:PREDICTED: chlorophyllase-1-like [Camelina sativa]|uniref:chlorophyllase n=1 Tax=Camelina sativa TaxID=90675 RepID=A0ABM0WWJ8_CAMSA|nr:PREDICTED: chlorophyllase-1-like [Camelina sativa]
MLQMEAIDDHDSQTLLTVATPAAFEMGSLPTTVITADPSRNDLTAPPKPVIIISPTVAGTYPVVLFFHGFYLHNYFYSDLLNHVSSHGYILVAPQLCKLMPPGGQVEVDDAGSVINWTTENLKAHLPSSVNAHGEYTALVGHSRGGKTAFAVALGHAATLDPSFKFSALIGIDPVAGSNKFMRTDPHILTYEPDSFELDIPVVVVGTGLGPERKNVMPPCAPTDLNHEEFYRECKATKSHFVAADFGHMDMLDDDLPGFVGFMAGCMCKNGKGKKSEMRKFVGGIVVAFLKYSLWGEKAEIRRIVKDPLVSPVRLDPSPELEEASG